MPRAFFSRSRAPYESFSRGSLRDLRGTSYASRDGMIADTGTERGLDFSAE
jgi:hypothetical protein